MKCKHYIFKKINEQQEIRSKKYELNHYYILKISSQILLTVTIHSTVELHAVEPATGSIFSDNHSFNFAIKYLHPITFFHQFKSKLIHMNCANATFYTNKK